MNIYENRPNIHPLACVDESAKIGPGSVVWQFASVLKNVVIGSDCSVGACAEIGRGSRIGPGTRISRGVFLPNNSIVGEQVFIGPNATFTDDRRPQAGNGDYIAEPPVLEDGCSVGANCTILPGIRIGKGAMVGAGSTVTKNVPAGAVVRGDQAKEYLTPLRALNREHPHYGATS